MEEERDMREKILLKNRVIMHGEGQDDERRGRDELEDSYEQEADEDGAWMSLSGTREFMSPYIIT